MSAPDASSCDAGGWPKEAKAGADDFPGRFREIVSDPNNLRIPRVPLAGFTGTDERTGTRYVVMHNGLRVLLDEAAYYGDFAQILIINRGVHEPQEEYAFGRVLEVLDPGLPMLELGAYWGFYSLWYKQRFPESPVFLVEPVPENLEVGRRNFALNGCDGEFLQGGVQPGGFDVSRFVANRGIGELGVLHADVQGAEALLLDSIADLLDAQRIRFLFVSTHSQRLHEDCRARLEGHGYRILAAADFDRQTFSYDGVLVACSRHCGMEPFDLCSRADREWLGVVAADGGESTCHNGRHTSHPERA